MSLGDTAPLVTIAHDWASPVERVRSTPAAVMQNRDGSEQRLSLSHLATDRLTYRLTAPSAFDAAIFPALPDLATDTIVRVPRWEDQTRTGSAADAGSAIVIACDTVDRPTFVVGAQVILWRSPSSYEVTTIDALTTTSITADLVSAWGAGTVVAPVMAGRVVLPVALAHWVPTTGALTFAVDFDLADLAGVGTGGDAAAGVPYAISVTSIVIGRGGRAPIIAIVTDAEGNVLVGEPIAWTSADPVNAPVYASGDPTVAMVGNPNGGTTSKTITATLGAVVGTGGAYLLG